MGTQLVEHKAIVLHALEWPQTVSVAARHRARSRLILLPLDRTVGRQTLSRRLAAIQVLTVNIGQYITVGRIRFAVGAPLLLRLTRAAVAPFAVRDARSSALEIDRFGEIDAVDVILDNAAVVVRFFYALQSQRVFACFAASGAFRNTPTGNGVRLVIVNKICGFSK